MGLKYLSGYEQLIHAEYLSLRAAHSQEAAEELAVLGQLSEAGWGSLGGSSRQALNLLHPRCHKVGGWGVFFHADDTWRGKCEVTVLGVVDLSKISEDNARKIANERLEASQAKRK